MGIDSPSESAWLEPTTQTIWGFVRWHAWPRKLAWPVLNVSADRASGQDGPHNLSFLIRSRGKDGTRRNRETTG